MGRSHGREKLNRVKASLLEKALESDIVIQNHFAYLLTPHCCLRAYVVTSSSQSDKLFPTNVRNWERKFTDICGYFFALSTTRNNERKKSRMNRHVVNKTHMTRSTRNSFMCPFILKCCVVERFQLSPENVSNIDL